MTTHIRQGRLAVLASLLLAASLAHSSGQALSADPVAGGNGVDSVKWQYASRLAPHIAIFDAGNGNYNYRVDFINSDSSPIWDFTIWTVATPSSAFGTFPNYATLSLNNVLPEYDARNLNPALTDDPHMWYGSGPWPPTTGLPVGWGAELLFELPGYYTSFLYGYETLASGYTQSNGGYLAAVGTVFVPEPAVTSLLVLGLLGCWRPGRRTRS